MPPPSESGIAPLAVATLGQLGRYELLSLLAKGGMGEVYLARARSVGGFEKLVVIKRNLPSLAADSAPLLAEARLVATLQHTNIVQVYDVETDGPTVFIAMEFLHGQDVRSIVKRSWGTGERLPLDHAVAIALAMCAGLHYAHDKRDSDGTLLEIVHRDVSPSNVFVTYDGGVKLIDFGIAKATTLPSETQLGTIKGKPGYMSPEQCRGEPLDRRTDVFCVGIMLYEMTLGRRPFTGENEYLLYRDICDGEPPLPRSIDPAYPAALEAIVTKALAKNRRHRHATAEQLQHELAQLASELRLDISQFALASYMARVYRAELEAWRTAQHAGQSLIEHVIRKVTTSVPVVEGSPRPPEVSAATTAPATPRLAPPRRRLAAAAIAGAVIAIGVAAVIAVRTRGEPAASAAASPTAGSAAKPPTPAPAPASAAPTAAPRPPAGSPTVDREISATSSGEPVSGPARSEPRVRPKRPKSKRAPPAGAGSTVVVPGPDDPI